MPARGEYRIEVTVRLLSEDEQKQFLAAAREAGFQVLNNGYAFIVPGLVERQATALRDGLEHMGIHSSIGISTNE